MRITAGESLPNPRASVPTVLKLHSSPTSAELKTSVICAALADDTQLESLRAHSVWPARMRASRTDPGSEGLISEIALRRRAANCCAEIISAVFRKTMRFAPAMSALISRPNFRLYSEYILRGGLSPLKE